MESKEFKVFKAGLYFVGGQLRLERYTPLRIWIHFTAFMHFLMRDLALIPSEEYLQLASRSGLFSRKTKEEPIYDGKVEAKSTLNP